MPQCRPTGIGGTCGMKGGLFNPFFNHNAYSPSTTYQAILTAAASAGITQLPPSTIQEEQDTLIVGLKNLLGSKAGTNRCAFIFSTNDDNTQSFSTINIFNPTGTKGQYLTTGAGSITYDRRGALADINGAYFNTGFNPTSAGMNVNSCFEGFFVWKAAISGNVLSGNVTATSCTIRNASTTAQRLNSGGNIASALDLSGVGFKAINRPDANGISGYADKVKTDKTIASFGLPNENRMIFRQGAGYSDAGVGFYILTDSLTEAEENGVRDLVNTYFKNIYRKQYLDTTPINLYFMGPPGQSNLTGRAVNSEASAELQGQVGAMVLKLSPTPPGSIDETSQWQILAMGVNNTTESLGTQHGLEMRFGYNMYQANQNTWIVKFGSGGTSMSVNWNKDGGLYRAYIETVLLRVALPYLRHTVRRPIVFRGVIDFQGESDSSGGLGAAYGASYDAMIIDFLDRLDNAGYVTNKLRWYSFVPKYSAAAGYTETDYNNMKTGKINTMVNFAANHPTYWGTRIVGTTYRETDDLPRLDNEHVNAAGMNTAGIAAAAYFAQYLNE